MALIHQVYDTDAHFKIDPVTRAIKNESTGKNVLIQYDHNSERFTFDLPKLIDGHDMSKSTSVEIHYINIDSADKTKSNADVYPVDDLQISPEDANVVICSWLISQNATQYAGSLNFLLKFKCVDDSGEVVYRWNTAIFTGISVSSGMDNSEAIVEEYSDVLAQWEARIAALEANAGGDAVLLIVTLSEDESTASHSASEIYTHVQNGGSVVLKYYTQLLALTAVDYYEEDQWGQAFFNHINAEENYTFGYTIYEDRMAEYFETYFARGDTVAELENALGDVSSALDSIIAIQNELIGGEEA